jgi:hypothetical protein
MSQIHLEPKDLHSILQEVSNGQASFDKGMVKFIHGELAISLGEVELSQQLRLSYGKLRVLPDSIKLNAQGLKADFKISLDN